MSSGQINEIEDNLSQLRLEKVVFKTKFESSSVDSRQNVSSLDIYKKSLHCRKVKIPSVNDDDHRNTFIAKRRLQKELKEFNLSPTADISAH